MLNNDTTEGLPSRALPAPPRARLACSLTGRKEEGLGWPALGAGKGKTRTLLHRSRSHEEKRRES